jgi:hypothetical protein
MFLLIIILFLSPNKNICIINLTMKNLSLQLIRTKVLQYIFYKYNFLEQNMLIILCSYFVFFFISEHGGFIISVS